MYTDLNSLPSLLKLSKPHSPRTHAVAPHELRCDSPAHSANKAALSLHGVNSPLVPHLSHTPICRCYALRSLSLSLSLSLRRLRQTAGGWRVGRLRHDHQREKKEARGVNPCGGG